MEWLKQQPDTSSQPEMGDTSALNLLEMLQVKYIAGESPEIDLLTTFNVSQLSGSFGINSLQAKPALSIVYPDTNRPPLILSRDDLYTSAIFITIADKEYLASASRDGIRLWNLANNTSKVVYKCEESRVWLLCVIDERTVAWVAESQSSDGLIHIHILNTDAEMWTLSSNHFMKANHKVADISFMKTTDGTPSFLLSFVFGGLIQCVEMVGGRVRWHVDTRQMGQTFCPWSICTDGSTVFVADIIPNQLHLLSVEDGSVLRSISLYPLGIRLPGCVLAQGEYLYIGHVNEKGDRYCISKFTKPTDV